MVGPSAYKPASSSADFTCALATGMRYSMPCRRRPPPISSGGLPSCVRTSAPISRSGLATRSMGRCMSDSSPISVEAKDCAASNPANNRMAVPALPMSSACAAALSPCNPTPRTRTRAGSGCSMRTPSARIALRLARQSSLARKPRTSLSPEASADSKDGAVGDGLVARQRHAARERAAPAAPRCI